MALAGRGAFVLVDKEVLFLAGKGAFRLVDKEVLFLAGKEAFRLVDKEVFVLGREYVEDKKKVWVNKDGSHPFGKVVLVFLGSLRVDPNLKVLF